MSARVTCLVLANLGLLGCKEKAAVTTDPPASSVVIGPPSASVAPPPAWTAPTVVVGPPGSGSATLNPAGAPCQKDSDCMTHWCTEIGDGRPKTCQWRAVRGRPLVVDGEAHLAEYMRPFAPRVTTEEIARLQDAAREEHASIAAFARTIAELMAFGAPTWLLSETHRALGDEIRHTERSLAMLEKLTGERPVVGALEAAALPLARPIEEFFRDVLRGGAIGESIAADEAETRRLATSDEELRAFYEMIVIDESRHAALAFKTLRWLLDRNPELRPILDEERAGLRGDTALLVAPLLETLV